MKPTAAEVKAELKLLRALKPRLPHRNEWGVNNHTLLAAQYQTLRYGLSMDDIRRQWPDTSDTLGEAQGAAEDALYWLEGGEILSPSERWAIGQISILQTPIKQGVL